MVRRLSIPASEREYRARSQALAHPVQGSSRRVRASASQLDDRPDQAEGGAEVLHLRHPIHEHLCDRQQQTVRARGEGMHRQASPLGSVRRHAPRRNRDHSDRHLESRQAEDGPFAQARQQHPRLLEQGVELRQGGGDPHQGSQDHVLETATAHVRLSHLR